MLPLSRDIDVRILAIDPGEKYLGVAVSDEGQRLARPLTTLRHTARAADAAAIVALAEQHAAGKIIVGAALDSDGQTGPQARHAENLALALRALTPIPVALHDESHSSLAANQAMRDIGKSRRDRREQIHARAAAVILQAYLDGRTPETP